jgi:hypothetical protein
MAFERNLWQWLRAGLTPLIAQGRLHICRVENTVGAGYPDVEGCLDGRTFHLELKGADRPRRPTTPITVRIRRAQVLWLRKRWAVGGACFLLLRVGQGRQVRRYMVRGDWASRIERIPETELEELSLISIDQKPQGIIERASLIRKGVRAK